MSRIPDCRKEGPYCQDNLSEGNENYINGYDKAVEEIDCLFDNLDIYPDVELIFDPDVAVVNKDKVTLVRAAVADYLEMTRNEIITSLIDEQEADN